MNIVVLSVGKKHEAMYEEALLEFTSRIQHYSSLEWKFIAPSQTADPEKEAESILESLRPEDVVVSLDEKGRVLDTVKFAKFLEQQQVASVKKLVFVIGGAYGLSKKVLDRSVLVLSLSSLTFPHQLVRVILAEQIYRGFTVIRGEKYHHGN